ncbi:MAG: metalloregulator ArsR/SmtB family transcription factor [Ahrensia sp.]
MKDADIDLAAQMGALAHPARLKILRWLARHEHCRCKQVCDALPLAQSTVSQHLKVLVEAGLVRCERRGTASHFIINRPELDVLAQSTGLFVQACCTPGSAEESHPF